MRPSRRLTRACTEPQAARRRRPDLAREHSAPAQSARVGGRPLRRGGPAQPTRPRPAHRPGHRAANARPDRRSPRRLQPSNSPPRHTVQPGYEGSRCCLLRPRPGPPSQGRRGGGARRVRPRDPDRPRRPERVHRPGRLPPRALRGCRRRSRVTTRPFAATRHIRELSPGGARPSPGSVRTNSRSPSSTKPSGSTRASPGARAFAARMLAQRGQNEQALADFDAVIRLVPDDAAAFKDRGGILVRLGQYERRSPTWTSPIRLDPSRATAYQNRGAAYNGLGQYERAVADLDEAIRLDPRNAGRTPTVGSPARARPDRAGDRRSQRGDPARPEQRDRAPQPGRRVCPARADRRGDPRLRRSWRLDARIVAAYVRQGRSLQGLDRREKPIRAEDMALRLSPVGRERLLAAGDTRRSKGDWSRRHRRLLAGPPDRPGEH